MTTTAPPIAPLSPSFLAEIAAGWAVTTSSEDVETPVPGDRTFLRVLLTEAYDVWVIRWGAEGRAPLHDHGGSTGALHVLAGTLVEYRPNPAGVGPTLRRELGPDANRAMAASHVHEVVNEGDQVVTSVHVYSPPLTTMTHYERADDESLHASWIEPIIGPDRRSHAPSCVV